MLIPAIDILDGKCVRLYQGNYNSSKVYNNSPLDQALLFKDLGFKRLHIVDLDGSKDGLPKNFKVIEGIVKKTGLDIEVGGGIRDFLTIKNYISIGIKWVILGSILVKKPGVIEESMEYVNNIIAGIDFKNNSFATDGWLKDSGKKPIDFALEIKNKYSINTFLFTDISVDGTLTGPNINFYKEASKYFDNIIASGGVGKDKDISDLMAIKGIKGVVVGKAIYENKIDIKKWV